MSWNDKPRISLSDMQARLASNREMLQKNSSPTKTPSKSYLRKQRKLKANAKSEDEAEAKIEVEANDEVSKDTEITKIMKNQQSEKEFKPSIEEMRKEFMKMLTRVEKLEEKIENIDKRVFALEAVDQKVENIDQKIMALEDFDKKVENIDQKIVALESFDKKVENIDQKIVALEDFDKKVESIDKKIDALENFDKKVENIDQEIIALSIQNYEKKYILKKVPTELKKGETKEDIEVTKNIVEEILNIAEMDLKSIEQVYRMYPNKNSKKPRQRAENKSPNIFLKFASEQEIYSFSEKLKRIKNVEKFKDLQFEKCVPFCLMDQWNSANFEAYRLRKDKDMKTKTVLRSNGIELLAKLKNEDDFVKLDSWKKKQNQ